MIQKRILCPVCGSKTRVRIREDTVLENFPLYCPKCKHETLISARQLNISVIKEPDAQTIRGTGTPALLLGTLAQLVSPWYFGMITAFIPK